jgi:hypothetical protein
VGYAPVKPQEKGLLDEFFRISAVQATTVDTARVSAVTGSVAASLMVMLLYSTLKRLNLNNNGQPSVTGFLAPKPPFSAAFLITPEPCLNAAYSLVTESFACRSA